jgi:hypothetical protein
VVFRNFVLQFGQSARLDITMDVGNIDHTVEVAATVPPLQTENASVGQVIALEAVNDLPLNGGNFVQLAILAPGVSGPDYAQPSTTEASQQLFGQSSQAEQPAPGRRALDHQRSSKDTLFSRLSADWSTMVIPDTFNHDIGGSNVSFAGDDSVKGRNLVAAKTHIFSPSTIG